MGSFLSTLASVFTNVSTVFASIGLILATSSFISGLQLVKGARTVEKKIHRGNGFLTIGIYLILAVMANLQEGLRFWALLGWLSGIAILLLKIWIVRKKMRRGYKYVSWMGAMMILVWLYMVYIHIPV